VNWTRGIRCRLWQLSWIALMACPPPAGDDAAVKDGATLDAVRMDSARDDGARSDSAPRDVSLPDRSPRDGAARDYGPWDSAGCVGEDAAWTADHGFCIRVPQLRDVPTTDMAGNVSLQPTLDVDYVCTLDYGTLHGFVYVQAHATSCEYGCDMVVDGAWINIGGTVSPSVASYDWGGRHGNDFIIVRHDDKVFKYYHSVFGWGWHACQPPDCSEVYQADGTTLIENGCTFARTLPQVCVKVSEDGSVPPLVDNRVLCQGYEQFLDAGTGG